MEAQVSIFTPFSFFFVLHGSWQLNTRRRLPSSISVSFWLFSSLEKSKALEFESRNRCASEEITPKLEECDWDGGGERHPNLQQGRNSFSVTHSLRFRRFFFIKLGFVFGWLRSIIVACFRFQFFGSFFGCPLIKLSWFRPNWPWIKLLHWIAVLKLVIRLMISMLVDLAFDCLWCQCIGIACVSGCHELNRTLVHQGYSSKQYNMALFGDCIQYQRPMWIWLKIGYTSLERNALDWRHRVEDTLSLLVGPVLTYLFLLKAAGKLL